jgi:F-type H+-transporting ATPase subunit b
MIGFIALIYFKARKPILAFLDARSIKIKAELDEAIKLRSEAEALLAEAHKQQQNATSVAQKIVQQAQDTAARIERETALKLQELLNRKEAQLSERLARSEAAAVENIRVKAAEIATATAEYILTENLSKGGRKLLDDAISDIPAALKN